MIKSLNTNKIVARVDDIKYCIQYTFLITMKYGIQYTFLITMNLKRVFVQVSAKIEKCSVLHIFVQKLFT